MRTPLFDKHKELNARIIDFGGFEMPVEYSGIKDEHITVRKNVGIFDVSHMGEIWVTGANATEYLQRIVSNNVARLKPNKAQYNYFPNGRGGIVDDLIIYKYSNEKYLLVVNASNTQKDFDWLVKNNKEKVGIENVSSDFGQIAVQGPKAIDVMKKISNVDFDSMKPFSFLHDTVAGVENVLIATTGYTGAGGVELYFPAEYSSKIWDMLLLEGKEFGLKPIGLGARDTLRLEMGYNLYGNDISDETSPIEAGLLWVTKFEGKENMIDYETLKEQAEEGVSQKLVAFEMIDRGIPRHDYPIDNADGTVVGVVTSGSISPITNKGIGMGYVNTAHSNVGSAIYIQVRNKMLKAEIVKLPFVK